MELYDWKECFKTECDFCCDKFWQSITVWISRPHVLNKRIGATSIFVVGPHSTDGIKACYDFFKENLEANVLAVENGITKLIEDYNEIRKYNFCCNYDVSLRVLYPKTGDCLAENIELIFEDKNQNLVTFVKPDRRLSNVYPISSPYTIKFDEKYIRLLAPVANNGNNSINWLISILLPKLVRWMTPELQKNSLTSNSLISADRYLKIYHNMKNKYYNKILEIWTESTDPKKFIIEDIAIASYLLVLWNGIPQTFVDLGCGNGLLVYLLNSENHHGIGLDIRARKIWKSYPKYTTLKECTIQPSLNCVFPKHDWIIGNHSDELTPWIPVIAAKSSYKTKFFLLPCCLFEFDGNKYARNSTNKTCYEEYMEYVEHISQLSGFKVERDRLKIPSTKRICFVGRERTYLKSDELQSQKVIDNFVNNKVKNSSLIKLRESKENVRNCTQLGKDFLNAVVMDVANHILSNAKDSTSWRDGEFTPLQDLIKLLSSERRQKLKNECGGLQTLLKNHHHIFVVSEGKVKLRKPTVRNINCNFSKSKDCWFFVHHPDSCPLTDEECSYIHGN